jgi:hypothetical protein
MSDAVPNALARKVGPLPVGAWVAVAAGGIAAALFLNKRTPAAIEVQDADAGLDNTMPGAGNLSVGAAASNPTSTSPLGGGYPMPTTNEEWAQAVMRALIAKGYEPTVIDDAVGKYLSGGTLTIRERAIISLALIAAGGPPVPPPPPLTGSPSLPSPSLPAPPRDTLPPSRPNPTSTSSGRVQIVSIYRGGTGLGDGRQTFAPGEPHPSGGIGGGKPAPTKSAPPKRAPIIRRRG